MANALRLGIEIEAEGAQQSARAIASVQEELEGVQFDGSSFASAQQVIGATTRQLQELAETFNFDGAAPMNLPVVSRLLAELRADVNTTTEDLESLREASGLTTEEFEALNAALQQIEKRNTDSLARLASSLGTNLGGAKEFADSLGLTADEASAAYARMRQLSSAGATQEEVFTALSRELNLTAEQYEQLAAAANRSRVAAQEADTDTGGGGVGIAEGFGQAFGALTKVSFGINEIIGAGQAMIASLGPAYELLIGANERLNQQLLASQANIAATSDLSVGGVAITDPTEKIQASEGALREALKDLEIQTQDLVGVTDADVQGVFQVLLQNTNALTGQSKVFENSIESATNLTTGLVATMGTLGVPIDQAASEVGDLIKGQITADSIIGKSLQINSAMVAEWKSQGILVDELNKKFEVFKAGNALAANSIAGVTSNIQSAFEDIGRQVGEDLLMPVVDSLKVVMNFLNDNKAAFIQFGKEGVDYISGIVAQIGEIIQSIGSRWIELYAPIREVMEGQIAPTIEYVTEYVGQLIKQFEAIGESLLSIATVIMPISTGAIKGLMAVMNGLMDASMSITPIVTRAFQGLSVVIGGLAKVLTPVTQVIGGFVALVGKALGGAIGLVGAGIERIANNAENFFGRVPNLFNGFKSPLQESKEAVESYANSFALLSTEAEKRLGDLEGAIEARNAAEENGLGLTQAQLDAEKKALSQSKLTLDALKAQREELEGAAITGSENREAIEGQKSALDEQIESLETNIELLGENGGALEINAKAAQDLGTATEQLGQKLSGALDKLASGTGTSEELEAAAETVMEVGQQQLELGQITRDEYRKNVEEIAKNTTLSAEQQLAAEEKLTEMKEAELQKRLQAFQNSQAEIERDLAAGRIDEIDGEQQLTASKLEAIDIETKARKEALAELVAAGRGDTEAADEIRQQLTDLAGEAEEIAYESAKKISELRLKELEEEQAKARQILEKSQIEQQNALKRLRLAGLAGETEERELDLAQKQKATEEELKLEKKANRERLSERKKLLQEELKLASSPEEAAEIRKRFNEEVEQSRRDEAIKTSQLEGDLLDIQIQKEEVAREKILAQIEAQILTQQLGDNAHLASLDEAERSLSRQSDLRQQQAALLAAQNALEQDGINARVEGFNRALGVQKDITDFADKQEGINDKIADQQENLKNIAQGIVEKQLALNSATSAREEILALQISREEEGSRKRIELEKQLEGATRARAKERLGLERELAKITGNQSGVIAAQLALSKEGSQERLNLEKRLIQETEKERKAAAEKEIEEARKAAEEEKEAIAEAEKQKVIAAAQEKQRREELATLGVDEDATDVEIIKAKQAAEDELARKKLEALRAEQEQQRIALEIDIQRNELAAKRAAIAANAAVLQAQQNKLEAESALASDPNNEVLKAQVALANQGVQLAMEGVKAAEEDAVAQAQAAANQRELLALQQQSALEQAQRSEQTRQLDQARELAAAGVRDATAIATAGDLRDTDFAPPPPPAPPDPAQFQGVIDALSSLRAEPLNIPPITIDPDNPMNQNLEGLRQDFQTLAAVLANSSGGTTINVGPNRGATSNPDVGRTMVSGAGL